MGLYPTWYCARPRDYLERPRMLASLFPSVLSRSPAVGLRTPPQIRIKSVCAIGAKSMDVNTVRHSALAGRRRSLFYMKTWTERYRVGSDPETFLVPGPVFITVYIPLSTDLALPFECTMYGFDCAAPRNRLNSRSSNAFGNLSTGRSSLS